MRVGDSPSDHLICLRHEQHITVKVFLSVSRQYSWPRMKSPGISRRNYERLPSETKARLIALLEDIKKELRPRFSLRFLQLDGRWKDLNPPRFLALPEDHYHRLIKGSRGLTSRHKQELLDKIDELYELSSEPTSEAPGLERWLENSLS